MLIFHSEQAKKIKNDPKRTAPKTSLESREAPKSVKALPPMLSPLHIVLDEHDIRLPELLSPQLPEEIEEALARFYEAKDAAKHAVADTRDQHGPREGKTFEARNERRNLPDAPGVARKTVKSKPKHVGKLESDMSPERNSRIIKLKYGRRNLRNVERLIHMKSKPGQSFEDAMRNARNEEKKRTRDVADDNHDRPAKKSKPPAHLDVDQQPRTPLSSAQKSPGIPPPSHHRSLLGTPKKGEAMARVSSADSHHHARTPVGANTTPKPIPTSTPASVDRSRVSAVAAGSSRFVENVETLKADFPRYQEMGTTLKRKMDSVLQTKTGVVPNLTTEEEKLGSVIGIESAAAYMLGFSAFDKWRKMERKFNGGENWEQLLALLPFIQRVTKKYPELSATAHQVVAVTREVLAALHIERLAAESGKDGQVEGRFKDAMVKNGRERVNAWNAYLAEVENVGGGAIAAWFRGDIREIVEGVLGVLTDFTAREGLKWEPTVKI